jgi:hypothetical protein
MQIACAGALFLTAEIRNSHPQMPSIADRLHRVISAKFGRRASAPFQFCPQPSSLSRTDAIDRPQMTRINANFRIKKNDLFEVKDGRSSVSPSHLVISFVPIRVMSDVASLGTWANCIGTAQLSSIIAA